MCGFAQAEFEVYQCQGILEVQIVRKLAGQDGDLVPRQLEVYIGQKAGVLQAQAAAVAMILDAALKQGQGFVDVSLLMKQLGEQQRGPLMRRVVGQRLGGPGLGGGQVVLLSMDDGRAKAISSASARS